MKTCTCPHKATRNGLIRTGRNALCPFHGRPLVIERVPPPVAAFVAAKPGHHWCGKCGLFHSPGALCDPSNET